MLLCDINISAFSEVRADHYNSQQAISVEPIDSMNQSNYFIKRNRVQSYCCKICRKGKPCGNNCINRNYTCHKPTGCAC